MSILTTDNYIKLAKFYRENPALFVKEINGFELTAQQEQVFKVFPQALKEGKGISVKSGHSTGKTFVEANLITFIMFCYPKSKIVCLANTFAQLMDVMRSEVTKIFNHSKLKDMFDMTRTTIKHREYPDEWFCTFRTANKPESIAGFHNDTGLVFVIDEASGIDQEILEAIEGALTQKNNVSCMFGNPTRTNGAFFDSFNTKRQFFHTFTFSSKDSPLVKASYWQSIASKYGEDSDVFRVRVLGEFPKAEKDSLIPISLCEKSVLNEVSSDGCDVLEVGVDVARYGDDKTQIYERVGEEIKHYKELTKSATTEIIGILVNYVRMNEDNVSKIYVNIDDTGVGGGVTDGLQEKIDEGYIGVKCEVIINPVNNGSRAMDKKTFFNKGIEMYWFMRDFLKHGKIPNDNELIAELSSRKYNINSKGQLMLEKKDDFKKRIHKSPDKADACVLSCYSLVYNLDIMSNLNEEADVDNERLKDKLEDFKVGSVRDRMNFFKKVKRN